jgi:hypothetical protein
MVTFDVGAQDYNTLLATIENKTPDIYKQLNADDKLMEEISRIDGQYLINVDVPPFSLESIRKIHGGEGFDFEHANEYALWRVILLRYFNDNVYGLYESFENGVLVYPENPPSSETQQNAETWQTADTWQTAATSTPVEAWKRSVPAAIATAVGGGVVESGYGSVRQRGGADGGRGVYEDDWQNSLESSFVAYGVYQSPSATWLFQSSLPLQTRTDMESIKEKFKDDINDIVSLAACGFAGSVDARGISRLNSSNMWAPHRTPTTANCQYLQKQKLNTLSGRLEYITEKAIVGESCVVEDNVWEGLPDTNTEERYSKSMMNVFNQRGDLFGHMTTLFEPISGNIEPHKVINIQFIDVDAGGVNDWFLILYYGLFSHYYDRKALVHCWGGFGRTGYVILFYLLLDDIINYGNNSFWHIQVLNNSECVDYADILKKLLDFSSIHAGYMDDRTIREMNRGRSLSIRRINNISETLNTFLVFYNESSSNKINKKLINRYARKVRTPGGLTHHQQLIETSTNSLDDIIDSIKRKGMYEPLMNFKVRPWRKGMRDYPWRGWPRGRGGRREEGLTSFIPRIAVEWRRLFRWPVLNLKKMDDSAEVDYILIDGEIVKPVKTVQEFLNIANLLGYSDMLLNLGLNLASIKHVTDDELLEAGINKEFHRLRFIRYADRINDAKPVLNLKKLDDSAEVDYILIDGKIVKTVRTVQEFLNIAKLPAYSDMLLKLGLNLASIKHVTDDELLEAGINKEFHRWRFIRYAAMINDAKSVKHSGVKQSGGRKKKRRGLNKRSRKNISKRKKKYHLKKTKRKSKRH